MRSFLEKNSSIVLIFSVLLGIIFPYFSFLQKFITYFLITILFITFVKVDFGCIKIYFKKPILILFIIFLHSILTPLVTYLIYKSLGFNYIILSSIMLIALVPTGVAASAMTDLSNGNTLLSVLITIITHFLAPFLIPIFFYLLFRKVVQLDYLEVFITIFRLIFIPLLIALPFKRFFKKISKSISDNSKIITLIFVVLLSLSIVSINANYIRENPIEVFKYLILLFSVYLLFQITNFYIPFFLKLTDRIAISNSKTFNNIAIASVLALKFLDPKSSLIVVLGQIPWLIMLIPLNLILSFNKKKLKNNLN